MGAVADYLQGDPLSERYALSQDGDKVLIERGRMARGLIMKNFPKEIIQMLTAIEALDEIHSR